MCYSTHSNVSISVITMIKIIRNLNFPPAKCGCLKGWQLCQEGQTGLSFALFSCPPSSLEASGLLRHPWTSLSPLSQADCFWDIPGPLPVSLCLPQLPKPARSPQRHHSSWGRRTRGEAEPTAISLPAGGSQRDVPAHHHGLRLLLQ